MSLQIVEYSSDLYTGLYKLLKDVYNSNINEIDLEKNYINNSKKIYIAMFEDNIVGCAFLEIKMDYIRAYKYGFISYVAVDECYRRQGIGKKLVEFVLKVSKDNECSTVELTSADHRINAHNFYKTLGFKSKKTTIFIKDPL
jgi:ribosomal protein S18 acetylase RimI-like enzyme